MTDKLNLSATEEDQSKTAYFRKQFKRYAELGRENVVPYRHIIAPRVMKEVALVGLVLIKYGVTDEVLQQEIDLCRSLEEWQGDNCPDADSVIITSVTNCLVERTRALENFVKGKKGKGEFHAHACVRHTRNTLTYWSNPRTQGDPVANRNLLLTSLEASRFVLKLMNESDKWKRYATSRTNSR